MKKYFKAEILENIKLVEGIYKLSFYHEADIKPGQFYMLKPNTTLLGRPISVCEVDENKVSFVYAVVGQGTNEFKNLKQGDTLNVIGPLGNGFDYIKSYKRVALVSGGIGIAPMLELSKRLKQNNKDIKVDLVCGFRDEAYLIEDIKQYVDNVLISSDSGKVGKKGFVTEILNLDLYDTVLCCGPEPMMKNVVNKCKEKNVEVYVSMEKHMACGVGACLVCTCKTKNGNKRSCKDGPVFNGYEIEL
ncbi:dihydroorotate oxidase B, electron transfer subunit [Clostridium cavendishii DSM 21758]|uniref:Dihydroorotate dehydrogenase B (NAD(+)), electron transfer subunit n=1 Tax=Clostridium cavendishii DSM 21758 TaxID=1121302 RepID=A0A1M6F3S8_9CLOT|nr:dihydroorotate dehydrogenase electron transfer subunit [Clostridium cavendishii]SHI92325.1 dihydroorotate oxidase B, electron transfer subunit [Clostridium cavendishii DSM 21758]